MEESLGAWPYAPLVYVLAEIRTEILADLVDYHQDIAKQLRQDYPMQRKMNMARLVATGSQVLFEQQQDMVWELASPDNRTAVILRPNGLVLHATAYAGSGDFLSKLEHALRTFAMIPSIYVNRIGLRYIDFIVPDEGETPELYINPKLNPDLGLAEGRAGYVSTTWTSYPMNKGVLNLRYIRGTGQPSLSPDLGPVNLTPSPLMALGARANNCPTAILDTDRLIEFSPVEKLDIELVHTHFKEMREDIRHSFHDCAITEHAKTRWKGQ